MNSNETAGSDATVVPSATAWLGGLGLLPFVGLSIATLFAESNFETRLLYALTAYGAVILSFLGGIHWGLAINASENGTLFRRVAISVVPSLVAWSALLMTFRIGFIVLAATFAAMLLLDILASRRHEAPPWYPKLRWPLSIGAISSLLLAAIG